MAGAEHRRRRDHADQGPRAGRYEIVGNFGHNRDYGRFRVSVGDGLGKEIDFYQPDLAWKEVSLGTFNLPAGEDDDPPRSSSPTRRSSQRSTCWAWITLPKDASRLGPASTLYRLGQMGLAHACLARWDAPTLCLVRLHLTDA